jgi:hypothetical protein
MEQSHDSKRLEHFFDNFDRICTVTFEQQPKPVDSPRVRRNLTPSFVKATQASTKSLPDKIMLVKRETQKTSFSKDAIPAANPNQPDRLMINPPAYICLEPKIKAKSSSPRVIPPSFKNGLRRKKEKLSGEPKVKKSSELKLRLLQPFIEGTSASTCKNQKQSAAYFTSESSKRYKPNHLALSTDYLNKRILADIKALHSKVTSKKSIEKKGSKTTTTNLQSFSKLGASSKSTALLTNIKQPKNNSISVRKKAIGHEDQIRCMLRDSKLSLTENSHHFSKLGDTHGSLDSKGSLQFMINQKLKSLTRQLFEKFSSQKTKGNIGKSKSRIRNKEGCLRSESFQENFFIKAGILKPKLRSNVKNSSFVLPEEGSVINRKKNLVLSVADLNHKPHKQSLDRISPYVRPPSSLKSNSKKVLN